MIRATTLSPAVAVIDEEACIGCTLCIEACPVDAIVGAARLMHTVIAAECIGCKLCLPPCPVDCISMIESGKTLTREERKQRAGHAKLRYASRLARLQRERAERSPERENAAERKKRETVVRVMERARRKLERSR